MQIVFLFVLFFSSSLSFSHRIPLQKRSEPPQESPQESIDFSAVQHSIAKIHHKYRGSAEIIDSANLLVARSRNHPVDPNSEAHNRIPAHQGAIPSFDTHAAWSEDWVRYSDVKRDSIPEIIQDEEPLPAVIVPSFAGFRGRSRDEPEAVIEARTTRFRGPASGSAGISKSAMEAAAALSNTGSAFFATIEVGSGSVVVTIDTGSADLVIPSYQPSTSSVDLKKPFSLSYADGTRLSGQVYTDMVSFGTLAGSDIEFGVASSGTGILGLSFEAISSLKTTPFFQSLIAQGKVSNPQFSLRLDKNPELSFGGIAPESTEWHSVTSQTYWLLPATIYSNSEAIITNFNAIIDSGTAIVVAPTASAKEFWNSVPDSSPYGGGYYSFPCASPPSISFSFGSSATQFTLQVVSLGKVSASSIRCVGNIMGQDVGVDAWILGDSFMSSVVSHFNFGTNQIGFSKLT